MALSLFSEKIEDYEVHNMLGKGGFATVYHATCLKSGVEVAIKMIDKKLMQSTGMVHRVRQEVTIHSRLKHPSILELFTFFEDVNFVYLILELCHNGELQQYLKKNNEVLSEPEASHIMKQIIEGIQYLHSHNILHRDISLSNLLFTKNMQIKIADFGLATQLSRPDEKHLTLCGTPNFISPEVASRTQHGLEADVWGLGCLLYTLLVGTPPFEDHAIRSTLNRVVTANYRLPNFLSAEVKDLINSLLQKNPKDRIKLDMILEHPFIKRYDNSNGTSSSRLTQDSGIHTMSSRRDSAFSDSAIQKSYPSNVILRSNSDCSPYIGHFSECSNKSTDHGRAVLQCQGPIDQSCHSHFSSCCKSKSNHVSMECAGHGHSCCSNPCHLVNGQNNPHFPSSSCSLRTSNSCHCEANEDYCKEKIKFLKEHPPDNLMQFQKSKQKDFSRLCSSRLFPTRHQTKKCILSILETGEVCVEFLLTYGSKKKELVREVLRISPDGSNIYVYEPQGGKVPPTSEPPFLPSDGNYYAYDFEKLPEVHWKKYLYASRFVDLVKAKTPKVTYYSSKAKCFLMENLKDFEIMFYNAISGAKVAQHTTDDVSVITITDENGICRKLQAVGECNTLPKSLYDLWICAQELKMHCIQIESNMNQLPGENFPLIVGRRPNTSLSNKENQFNTLPSFSVSMASTAAQSTVTNSSHTRDKQMTVSGVGIAKQLPDGRLYVQCFDGEQIWIDDKHRIRYKYGDGRVVSYLYDSLPDKVLEKFREINKVLYSIFPKSKMRSLR
ncbi:serine/threonine-protein kinase PLK4-like [Photinus pyralis]|uniref:serine/threonine-protein kinase PLK4-like n=1 Tax=Photinus pyralis TaxID=7054 RepID=UPI001266FB63|nr:serine/threonine-protein kinase PLK4-like [Photinus pyralis]